MRRYIAFIISIMLISSLLTAATSNSYMLKETSAIYSKEYIADVGNLKELKNAFAADKNLNAKDPFFKYFDSFVASPAEISIKLPSCGPRYLLVSSGRTNRISEYGEIVLLKKPDSLKLTTRGCVLFFSFDPISIDLFLIKNDLKNLSHLKDFLCIFTQCIDLRSIGKSLEKKTYLLLFADPLSDKIVASIKEHNNLNIVYIKENKFILIEFKE